MGAGDTHWRDRAADMVAKGVVLRIGVAGKGQNFAVGFERVE